MDAAVALAREAWPQFFAGRPVLLYPRTPPGADPSPADGWGGPDQADLWAQPHPGWAAVLEDGRLTVTRPSGLAWYDGPLAATREWRRAARNHRAVLQITGPFAHPVEFPAAASRGVLQLVVVPFGFAGDSW